MVSTAWVFVSTEIHPDHVRIFIFTFTDKPFACLFAVTKEQNTRPEKKTPVTFAVFRDDRTDTTLVLANTQLLKMLSSCRMRTRLLQTIGHSGGNRGVPRSHIELLILRNKNSIQNESLDAGRRRSCSGNDAEVYPYLRNNFLRFAMSEKPSRPSATIDAAYTYTFFASVQT